MIPIYTNDFYTKSITASDDYTVNLMKDVCQGNKWEYTLEGNVFVFQEQPYHLMLGVLNWHINHKNAFEKHNGINQDPPAKDEELEPFALRRIKICRECEHYKAFICTQCGCFMPVKTRFKGSECPKQKWLKEVD